MLGERPAKTEPNLALALLATERAALSLAGAASCTAKPPPEAGVRLMRLGVRSSAAVRFAAGGTGLAAAREMVRTRGAALREAKVATDRVLLFCSTRAGAACLGILTTGAATGFGCIEAVGSISEPSGRTMTVRTLRGSGK